MVLSSTIRSMLVGNYGGLLRQSQHHTHTSVADPNSVIAAKKCLLSRLFSCPTAKDTAASAQQQQQQQTQLAVPSSADSALVPFHVYAGNTARASLGLRLARPHQHAHKCSASPKSAFRVKFFRCSCPAVFVSLFSGHTLACRAGAQHAEGEEEADEAYSTSDFVFRVRQAERYWSSILFQQYYRDGHQQQQPMDSNTQLVISSASPVYQQIIQSLASLQPAFAAIPHLVASPLCTLMSIASASSSLCSASSSVARDLPDEKNNDHIPLPGVVHAGATVEECGDRYTGQLCPQTAQQHGRGVMQYANGESYAGEWENGVQHGQGVMLYHGGRYSGQYVRGERSGQGVWEDEAGAKYEGEWRAGLREGRGEEWAGDELIYDGEWVANARHGYGVAQSVAGGWRYEGEWAAGVMDGYGSIEYSSGELWEGQWHAGAMHGEGMRISATGSSQLEVCQLGRLVSSTSQSQPASPTRQSSEGMGSLDSTAATSVEGVPSDRLELLSLLSQVASLQSVLVDKLSRVEELLVQPPTTKQPPAYPQLMGAVSMAA